MAVGQWAGAQSDTLRLPVDSAKMYQLRDVHIVGNRRTQEKIITRELSLSQGGTYSLQAMTDSLRWNRQRIYNTNLFNEVELQILPIDSTTADLLISVDERWYTYPLPIFSLADRNFNDWWVNQDANFQRVNFGIQFSQYNMRGRAERLQVTAQTGFENRFIFNYRVPYVDRKQQHGVFPEFFVLQAKNLGYETRDHLRLFLLGDEELRRSYGFNVIHTYRKKFYEYLYTGFGIYHTHIADTIAQLNPNYLGDGKTLQGFSTATVGYQFDIRNNVNYPLWGSNVLATVTKTGLGIYGDVDYWSVDVRGAKYWNLNNGFFLANSLHGYWSSDTDRPLINYYGLGFLPQIYVRGYELDLIEGSAFMLSKNSARKQLLKRKVDISRIMPLRQFQTFPIALYGKVFFDGAFVWNFENYHLNRRLTDKFIYGTGIGVDMVTVNDAVIRFEYSTNWSGETQFFINFATDI